MLAIRAPATLFAAMPRRLVAPIRTGALVAEPGRNFIACPFEEALFFTAAGLMRPIAAFAPSRMLVARIIAVVCHLVLQCIEAAGSGPDDAGEETNDHELPFRLCGAVGRAKATGRTPGGTGDCTG